MVLNPGSSSLSQEEREELEGMLKGGKLAARKLVRAQILLAADKGISDEGIAGTLRVSGSTVYRTKRRFVEGNLDGALSDEPRPGAGRKLSIKETALLAATACSAPPPGRARWTLELLADEMVKLTDHDDLSRETVRRRLAESQLKPSNPGVEPCGASPRSTASMSRAWRMCWISMRSRRIRCGR